MLDLDGMEAGKALDAEHSQSLEQPPKAETLIQIS